MASMANTRTRLARTVADYEALPDDVRAELMGGELYVTPAPELRHQEVIGQLFMVLKTHADLHAAGRVVLSPMDVHLPTGDVVQPDLIFVAREHEHICQRWIHGAPDLLIEVLSRFNAERDLVVKRDLYARNGVPAYWIVDPMERSIQLLRLEGDTYAPEGYFHGDAVCAPSSFPDLRLPLKQLFA